jgi:MFS transporter, PAT family, beta-lactamase induction signal transducer AmpG
MRAPMSEPTDPAKPTPPWYFLFLDLPFGAAVGYLSIAAPYWLERRGLGIDEIGVVVAAANLAHAAKLLWVPLLDLGSFRRVWYLAMACVTAAVFLTFALLPDPLGNLPLFGALLTALQASATTGHAANNALMATTTRFADKGKVGGFAMASNVGSTGLLGAAAILLADRVSFRAAGFAMAGVTLASAALALRIVEPRHVEEAVRRAGSFVRAAGLHLLAMFRDLWRTVRSREGFTGLVICLAPVGCQAMSNLFTGLSGTYGASVELVSAANGLGGGIASAVGALLGGVLADRMSRRLAYALSGGLTALCALAMAFAPPTPVTYAWGTFAYLFAGGIAFATWAGMVLEMVGLSAATATKYALFNASANVAISYVTRLDSLAGGWAERHLGVTSTRGALVTDALLTFAGITVLLVMIAVVRRQQARPPQSAPAQ